MNETQAIDWMRQVIRLQLEALATEDAYVLWLRRYMKALRQMPPQLPSEKNLETFLTGLAVEHDVSASTQNQAFNAILFFYRDVIGQSIGNVNTLRAHRPAHERPCSLILILILSCLPPCWDGSGTPRDARWDG
jgi:Phage integrase, N-terminal SAM-like domain